MVGQNLMAGHVLLGGVEVIKAILKCYWILICDYVDAFGTKVLVMGTICSRKTKLPFESHGWTSVEHDI